MQAAAIDRGRRAQAFGSRMPLSRDRRREPRGAGGSGSPTGDANFSVDLTGKLLVGRFTLVAQIIVNGNAMNAEIQRIPFDIASKP